MTVFNSKTLRLTILGSALLFISLPICMAQKSQLSIAYLKDDFSISELKKSSWNSAKEVHIDRNWNGTISAPGRQVLVRLLWSDKALYVRFEATQDEPLVVSENPDTTKKIRGLWDRDVCEIFMAPDKKEPKKYFEFEVAPTGEWIDLAIDLTSGKRLTDWHYHSGMEIAAKIEKDRIVMAMKIPWTAFGRIPKPDEIWLGNIFRCVGKDPNRGYLAWQPTLTEKPNYHVPEKFGRFLFEK